MGIGEEMKDSRYQLRYAAGLYWILDMWQEGVPYKKPLAVNEVGADIWRLLEQGKCDTEIAGVLRQKYNADEEMIAEDILQFRKRLQLSGIEI